MLQTVGETYGCDVGDKKSVICLLTADGEMQWPKPISTTRESFQKFFQGKSVAHVVIEVGQHSRWIKDVVTKAGHKVTVANPRRLQLITLSQRKTDPHDAELLARLGRADPKLLSPIKHRGNQAQADLAVAKSRDLLVRLRSGLVNQARGMVKAFGERLPTCNTECFHRKALDKVPELLRPALTPIFTALERLCEQIDLLDETLEQTAKRYPDVEVVSAIQGVGLLTALVFLLTIEDKERFPTSRAVGGFLGLVPRKDQSGEIDKQLAITKAGDPFVRRLLVNAANYVLGPFGQDSDLRRWGLKLATRGGKASKKRATIAVARKLAVLMHTLWRTGEVYEPLRQAKKLAA